MTESLNWIDWEPALRVVVNDSTYQSSPRQIVSESSRRDESRNDVQLVNKPEQCLADDV